MIRTICNIHCNEGLLMGLIRFSASILALLSVVLFGFCAFFIKDD